jgi:hypothetical protein
MSEQQHPDKISPTSSDRTIGNSHILMLYISSQMDPNTGPEDRLYLGFRQRNWESMRPFGAEFCGFYLNCMVRRT